MERLKNYLLVKHTPIIFIYLQLNNMIIWVGGGGVGTYAHSLSLNEKRNLGNMFY